MLETEDEASPAAASSGHPAAEVAETEHEEPWAAANPTVRGKKAVWANDRAAVQSRIEALKQQIAQAKSRKFPSQHDRSSCYLTMIFSS